MTTPLQPAAPEGQKIGRMVKILLAASLMCNLAVAGVFAGMWLRQGDKPPSPSAMRNLAFGPYGEAMSRAQRKELARSFSQSHADPRAMRAQMQGEFAQILTALRQVPLDENTLQEALSMQQARASQRMQDAQKALQDVILAMSDDERLVFAQNLEQILNRKRSSPPPRNRD